MAAAAVAGQGVDVQPPPQDDDDEGIYGGVPQQRITGPALFNVLGAVAMRGSEPQYSRITL